MPAHLPWLATYIDIQNLIGGPFSQQRLPSCTTDLIGPAVSEHGAHPLILPRPVNGPLSIDNRASRSTAQSCKKDNMMHQKHPDELHSCKRKTQGCINGQGPSWKQSVPSPVTHRFITYDMFGLSVWIMVPRVPTTLKILRNTPWGTTVCTVPVMKIQPQMRKVWNT